MLTSTVLTLCAVLEVKYLKNIVIGNPTNSSVSPFCCKSVRVKEKGDMQLFRETKTKTQTLYIYIWVYIHTTETENHHSLSLQHEQQLVAESGRQQDKL